MIIDAYCVLGVDREYDLTAETLIKQMDQESIDQAIIAPVDRCMAVHNREGNDFLLASARSHAGRFVPACSVNPWYGPEAVREIDRAIGEGARLLVLHPPVQGFQINDELVWPLIEAAGRSHVPVYVHSGIPGSSSPWQLVDLAFRYPETDFIMGHSGATDFWNDVVSAASSAPNVYIESSCARPFNFLHYLNALGVARGIMGSFAPNNDLSFEWEQMRQVLPPSEWNGLYGGNMERLLQKRGLL